MQASFFPATAAGALPPSSILPSPAGVSCGEPARHSVGEGRLSLARYLQDLDVAEAIGGCFFDAMAQAQAKREKD